MGDLLRGPGYVPDAAQAPPDHPVAREPEALPTAPWNAEDADPFWGFVSSFVSTCTSREATHYLGDLKAWYAWCLYQDVHPLAARGHHVDTWVRYLIEEPQAGTGRPATPATVARRLRCLSLFYDYFVPEANVTSTVPYRLGHARARRAHDTT